MGTNVDQLVDLFESLTVDSVPALTEHYAKDAHFRDPFNDVYGRESIGRIFTHMFLQVDEPHFFVLQRYMGTEGVMLLWRFEFRLRFGKPSQQRIEGVSRLRFDDAGQIVEHIDYWDAAGELYARLPVVGRLIGFLRRRLAAP